MPSLFVGYEANTSTFKAIFVVIAQNALPLDVGRIRIKINITLLGPLAS
jgi:hypothetical protein